MKHEQSKNNKNICGKQIHLIRTGQFDKKHQAITQDTLAARLQTAGLDIDRTAISRIESGKRQLKDLEAYIFAKVLKVSIEALFDADFDIE